MDSYDVLAEMFSRDLGQVCCLDIETCCWNGPIAIVGIYRPQEGPIHVSQWVRGRDLDAGALRHALHGIKFIVTFNGDRHDLPRLRRDFPGAVPADAISVDLYCLAQSLALDAGLKLLEGQFNIDRPEWMKRRRHVAVRLWRLYERQGLTRALQSLLDYNAQDTMNLYPLLNQLLARLDRKTRLLWAIEQSISE